MLLKGRPVLQVNGIISFVVVPRATELMAPRKDNHKWQRTEGACCICVTTDFIKIA